MSTLWVHTLIQSLPNLLKTLLELSGEQTTVVMCYEERTTGNKPLIERRFFEVRLQLDIDLFFLTLGLLFVSM